MLKGYSNVRKQSPNNRTAVRKISEKTMQNINKDSNDHSNDESTKRSPYLNREKSGETPV